jgi:hypothetical protein
MTKEDAIEVEGTVVEPLPNAQDIYHQYPSFAHRPHD